VRKRNTKIVATIGPASQTDIIISRLIETGMDVARLNFSHGDYQEHEKVYHLIRQHSKEQEISIGVLQDLQGPKIRTGNLKGNQVELCAGSIVQLTTEAVVGTETIIPIDFPIELDAIQPDTRVLLDDGNIELAVIRSGSRTIDTVVIVGGILKSHKGVNFPGFPLSVPGFTQKDRNDLDFGLKLGVDYIAVSFVRSAEDIRLVRQFIEENAPERNDIPIIAKLERPEALKHLDEIINCTDGVMVARGDLGVELPPEQVPIIQKLIIQKANQAGKIVITATQMLESMIQSPRPTRAEASDVANAIFDGSDAVMLSGETAVGKYPVKTIEMMNAIICQAEAHMKDWGHSDEIEVPELENDDAYYVSQAAGELAKDRNVNLISVFTKSGRTARFMSKTRPAVPIVAFTPQATTYYKLSLYWGVSPFISPMVKSFEEVIEVVEDTLVRCGLVYTGQQIVLLCGFPIQAQGKTNLALLHSIGL